MDNKNEFIDGLIMQGPDGKMPEFIKCKISIKREALIAYLQSKKEEWLNIDVKESREKKKWYASLNNWKPNQTNQVRQDINEQDKIQSDLNNFNQPQDFNQTNPNNNAF